jgi:hypothetical protein
MNAANHKRAQNYESDLDKAKGNILKAQVEMKNIDSEVANFQQKMAKSMHGLLTAFNNGFELMEKVKKQEQEDQITIEAQPEIEQNTRVQKVQSGMAILDTLTSKLKLSFNDDQPAVN